MFNKYSKYHIFAVLLICAVCIVIYSNTLSTPFIFDDKDSIEENASIRLNRLGFHELCNAVFKGSCSKRPVVGVSFALNYYFGKYDVKGYHIVNIIIHIINGILVYFLAQMMFGQSGGPGLKVKAERSKVKGQREEGKAQSSKLKAERSRGKGKKGEDAGGIPQYSIPIIALFAALIFIAHPIQTQAVTYIVQRYASMAAMFYLGAVLFYLKARITQVSGVRCQGAEEGRGAFSFQLSALYVLCILCGILALLSKQNTASLPLAILLVEYVFIDNTWQGWKKKIAWLAPVFAFFVAIVLYLSGAFGGGGQGAGLLEDVWELMRETEVVGRWSYLCTQFNVLVIYIRLLFLPVGQYLDYLYPFKTGFFDGLTLWAFLFLIGLVGFGVWNRKKWPLIGFGIFWFFITLSVESSIIPIRDALFEHRLYLPMFGFAIAVSYLVFHFLSKRRSLAVIVSLAIIVALGTATYLRNTTWRDKASIWSDVVSKNPFNHRAHANLGIALYKQGKAQDAIRHFSKAIEIRPGYGKAHYNMGLALELTGALNNAVVHYHEAIRINPGDEKAYVNLGIALARQGNLEEAISYFLKALQIKPASAEAYINLGRAFARQGELKKAKKSFLKALRISPESHDVHYSLGIVLARQGDRGEAVRHFSEALKTNPDLAGAHHHMGVLLAQQGNVEEARRHFFEVVRINPGSADAHMNLGIILSQQQNFKEAIVQFSEALRIDPGLEKARHYLRVLYRRRP